MAFHLKIEKSDLCHNFKFIFSASKWYIDLFNIYFKFAYSEVHQKKRALLIRKSVSYEKYMTVLWTDRCLYMKHAYDSYGMRQSIFYGETKYFSYDTSQKYVHVGTCISRRAPIKNSRIKSRVVFFDKKINYNLFEIKLLSFRWELVHLFTLKAVKVFKGHLINIHMYFLLSPRNWIRKKSKWIFVPP